MHHKLRAADKLKFARAKVLSSARDTAGVVEIMQELAASYPESGKIHAVLANAYWDLGNLTSAEEEFRKAIGLSPDMELASLGLFHCLWDQNRRDEAFEEMKRFMTVSDSDDYRRIVEELNR